MSEKHLSEAAWKALALKQKLKDPGLHKALAAFAHAASDDTEAQLAALDEVDKHGAALRKTSKDDKEVTGYLDEVLKEAARQRKTAEAARDASAADDDESDPAAYKKKLIAALQLVKRQGPEDPPVEFLLAIAGKQCAVWLARKVASSKKAQLTEMLGGGGAQFIAGTCVWEKNAHTFVPDKIPGGLARRIARALREETTVKYRVRVRSADSAIVDEADDDAGEAGDTGTIPTPPPPPSANATSAAPPATTPLPQGAEWTARLTAFLQKLKVQLAAGAGGAEDARLKASAAAVAARKGDFASAHAALDEAELALASGTNTGPAGQKSEERGAFVAFTQSRLAWDAARKTVAAELKKLQQAILEACREQPDFSVISDGTRRLYEMLEVLDERLGDTLDRALNATTDATRDEEHLAARAIVGEYKAFIDSEELLRDIDDNGFVPVAVASTLRATLSTIDSHLAA